MTGIWVSERTEPYVYWNMDEGSASSSGYLRVAIDTDIRLVPWKTWNSQWAWYAVKSNGLSGLTPTFLIAKADPLFTW